MKAFMREDFLLQTETAKQLYQNYAKNIPILDFHNHLNAEEIYEDKKFDTLSELWLGGDHYKWRAMRAFGITEEIITGKETEPYEKFKAWAETVQSAIGNPLYHWTHLELQRYFDIHLPLSKGTCDEIWNTCNKYLKKTEYSVRNLLDMQNVKLLCTTDDPVDDLFYHRKLKEEKFEIQVLPTFRPDRAIALEKDDFIEYIQTLGEVTKTNLDTIDKLLEALTTRLEYFITCGCRVSDHSIETRFFKPASKEQADGIYRRKLARQTITEEETAKYKGYMLSFLGEEYAKKGIVMQLHIGALRNNCTRLYQQLGKDVGLDSINDWNYAVELSQLLDNMDKNNKLPKVILYCLNPKDFEMLACMAGNFQSSGIKGKLQLGAAWWFLDNKNGIERQIDTLANMGLISTFVGMLTDSRSFLSFPRHEYFRRILCNKIGNWVENGEYPNDMEYLGGMIEQICYKNAKEYFNFRV